jgi:imidazolonepropionase-like amidohydrolase
MTPPMLRPERLLPLLLLCGAALAQEQVTVYQGARILPGAGPAVENGVLIVAGGRVQAIGGPSTAIPEGAVLNDVSGRTITPGLIDAGAQLGASPNDRNEQGQEVTPHMRILDAFDPSDRALVRARRGGVTAAHVTPGNRNVIGGLGAVIKTWGPSPAAMLLKDAAGLRIAMGGEPSMGNRAIRGGAVDSMYYRRPTTRMGVVWEVRKAFYDAKAYQEQTLAGAAQQDPGMDVLVRALKGDLLVFTTARAEQDIRTALRLSDEFGYRTAVEEATEAWRVPDELLRAKTWVLLGCPSADRVGGTGASDSADPRFHTVRVLHDKGVPFVITTGSNTQALDLVREAMFAVRHGLPPEAALEAVTSRPARLLGVDDRIGTLAPGKDEAVHVNGIRVEQ